MKIQAFIFNWRGHAERAARLEAKIRPLVGATVINCEDSARLQHPAWVHLNESAYFSAQWNEALSRFDADVFFHIQADAWHEDFAALFGRAAMCLGRDDIGVYEPNVDYTDLCYDTSRLREVSGGIFEVPLTDCTCWFLERSIISAFMPVDISINRYGWGIPGVAAAKCRLSQRICVRDYASTVSHPRGRGYPNDAALQQRNAYFRGFDAEHKEALRAVYEDYAELKASSR